MQSPLLAKITSPLSCIKVFPFTVKECIQSMEEAKGHVEASLKKILDIPAAQRNFGNTGKIYDVAVSDFHVTTCALGVVAQLALEKEVRDEANKQQVALEAFAIEKFSTNRDLFRALKEYSSLAPPKDDEGAYWIQKELDEFSRQGMDLPDDKFAKLKELKTDLSAITSQFQQNIAEDKTQLELTEEELVGTAPTVLSALSKNEAGTHYIVKMDTPTVIGILNHCSVSATREKVFCSYENRAYPINEKLLQEAVLKRHELSQLLKFPSYAHLNLADKMAKNPETAKAFIEELSAKVYKKWLIELENIKANLPAGCTLTPEGHIKAYDLAYAMNCIKKTQLQVDETAIQEYFPMDSTLEGLFFIYQQFFDITLTKVKNLEDLHVWHKDVDILEVKQKKSGELVGYVIIDLFPREGKFTHACCHDVVPPILLEDGTTSPGLAVVVANFPAATKDRPALLTHSDALTFFHEFGHSLHVLFSRTKQGSVAGTNVELDFVELPSQMLEQWLWEPSILRDIAKHYKTGEPLPQKLVDAKVASQNAFSGRDTLRQLHLATYSLDLFSAPFSVSSQPLNTHKLFLDLYDRLLPEVEVPKTNHMECAFGHLMGYDAGYYGYMWSKVFALDVFHFIRENNGLLDPSIGARYIKAILSRGGSRDPNVSVREMLGREPNNSAFLKSIGI